MPKIIEENGKRRLIVCWCGEDCYDTLAEAYEDSCDGDTIEIYLHMPQEFIDAYRTIERKHNARADINKSYK